MKIVAIPVLKCDTIKHATFLIENSGSMLGFVNGATDFVHVVIDLAQDSRLVKLSSTSFSYNLISGNEGSLRTYDLGSKVKNLSDRLTPDNFMTATSHSSDLNEMFKIALRKANSDSICFFFSDGIYDVGNSTNPLAELITKGIATRTAFIKKLNNENIATIIVKMESEFNGEFYPGSSSGYEKINHKRPYYIWIFGKAELLNEYFSEERLQKLRGFIDLARFQVLKVQSVPFQALDYDCKGFKLKNGKLNTYEKSKNVEDSSRFTVATNLSKLQMSESYLINKSNYSCSKGYMIDGIYIPENAPGNNLELFISKLTFKPTYIMYISTTNPPPLLSEIEIKLKNNRPDWIEETNTENDHPLNGDTNHTFGFSVLINGITEAYEEESKSQKFLTEFSININ